MNQKELLTINSDNVILNYKRFLKWNGKYYQTVKYTKTEFEKEMNQEPPLLNIDGSMVTGIEFE